MGAPPLQLPASPAHLGHVLLQRGRVVARGLELHLGLKLLLQRELLRAGTCEAHNTISHVSSHTNICVQ
jgi:hypothetical protein